MNHTHGIILVAIAVVLTLVFVAMHKVQRPSARVKVVVIGAACIALWTLILLVFRVI